MTTTLERVLERLFRVRESAPEPVLRRLIELAERQQRLCTPPHKTAFYK